MFRDRPRGGRTVTNEVVTQEELGGRYAHHEDRRGDVAFETTSKALLAAREFSVCCRQ